MHVGLVEAAGPLGSGEVLKLVNNYLFTAQVAVTDQAIALCRELGLDLVESAGVLETAQDCLIELRDYLANLVAEFRRPPADNLISDLAAAVENDDRLTDDEIVATCILLLFAGRETTTKAANRDPGVFADPNRLDLQRNPNRHIGFGFGMHDCLGTPIARLEGRIALGRLISRYPNIAPGAAAPTWHPTLVGRGMSSFPVSLGGSKF